MKNYIPSFLCILAALLWGFSFSAQKTASAGVDPFTVGAVGKFFAATFLLCLIPLLDRIKKQNGSPKREKFFNKTEIIGGAICGIVQSTASAFQQAGIQGGTDAGKSAFITALYVVIIPIIASILGKRSRLNVWISVAIAAVGFYFLCIDENFNITPSDILVLACAFMFAIHIIVIDRFSPQCDGVRMSCVQFIAGFFFNAVLALIFELPISGTAFVAALPALIYLGVFSSGMGYTLQIVAQKDVDPTIAGILFSLEAVFGVIGSAILLGEIMSPREYLGCAIVFTAVILSQLDFAAIKAKISKSSDKAN